jgi:TPR repeat protein
MLAALVRTGQGAERDPERARTLYQQACEGGYADACRRIAALK